MDQVEIKVEELSAVRKKLLFEIPWEEVKEELDSVYKDFGKKAKIRGFRPGKVPRGILETYFKEQAEGDAITNIVNRHFWKALEEKSIISLTQPEITQEGLNENTNFKFTASFETEPEFEPNGYQGIELEKEVIQVSEEGIDKRLLQIREMYATMEETSEPRPAAEGDYVIIDFSGSLGGEFQKELKADNYLLEIGSQRFVPGFEQQLVGMNNGETKSITVLFPVDYHEEKFAGKEVIFSVNMKNIKEKKLPELDENFIKNFDRYNSLEELKEDVRKALEDENTKTAEINLQNKVIEILLKENEFEAPPSLLERQIYYMMADTHKRMTAAGMDEKNAMDFSFKMRDKFTDEAIRAVKSFLILKKIAAKEKLSVDENEIENHIKDIAAKYGRNYQLLKDAYAKDDKKDSLKTELIQKKVFDFIEQHANIKFVEKSA